MDPVNSSDPSIQKILLSFSEYERLKNIESEYNRLLSSKRKSFVLNSEDNSAHNSSSQVGQGSEITKNLKLLNESSDEDDEVYQKVAKIVGKILQVPSTSQSQNLFEPKQKLSSIEVSSPITTPPIEFPQPIRKSEENDSYGK